jgi:cytochrome d ubiquinol oxidase subunit I
MISDPLILSRIQFAANISFHILFPTITISLGWILFFFKLKFIQTNQSYWQDSYKFWIKIFALSFGLGAVSGVTMSFQFGTNWPGFMKTVGNVAGPLLSYEILCAFFLEATFLGIMLFGQNKVSQKIHLISTFLVAFGTTLSAFWIISLNSWMHTPTGFQMIDGKAHVTNWLEVIFNPSLPYRLTHFLIASAITSSFLISGIASLKILLKDKSKSSINEFKFGVFLASVLIPVQIIVGDLHGLNTLEHQPVKLAAMESIWDTKSGVEAVIFAIPNETTKTNDFEISIPKLASIYLTHSIDGTVQGINSFPDHPPVKPVFFAFRIMVGIGIIMLLSSWYLSFKLLKNKNISNWNLYLMILLTFSGWIAVLAGWYVTEIGRQPWLVYGVLKTKDALSSVSSNLVLSSLLSYLSLYAFLLISYIFTIYYMTIKQVKINQSLE